MSSHTKVGLKSETLDNRPSRDSTSNVKFSLDGQLIGFMYVPIYSIVGEMLRDPCKCELSNKINSVTTLIFAR